MPKNNTGYDLKKYNDFEKECLPHMNSLYSYAFRFTGDRESANDLVQETYLKAFRFFDKFERGTNCKAWLFRILKNSFINDYRKKSQEPGKVDYDDIENFYESIKSSEIKTSHAIEDSFSSLLDDELTEAIKRLPEDFRTIILLSDIEGLTYEEIADFLDCPIGTVRSRLHRARKMLYAKLYKYAKERGYAK